MVTQLKLIACGVLVLITAAVTDVAAGPQSVCLFGKTECVLKKADALLKCEQKAETPGRPADPNAGACVDKARARFDGGSDPTKGCFHKLEVPGGCITVGDTGSVETLIDTCVAQIVGGIDPAPLDQSRCNAGKKKCAAKKLKSVLKCHQKAETPGQPIDPNAAGCLDNAKAKFDGGADPARGCFAKLENRSGSDCLPPLGNTAAVEAIVDSSCVGAFVAALETPTTTTTTTTTTLPGCDQFFSSCGSCGDGLCTFGAGVLVCVSSSTCGVGSCTEQQGCPADQALVVFSAPGCGLYGLGSACCTPCP
jgi:hypothetical protein